MKGDEYYGRDKGMMCGMCESHINDCIRNKFKVSKVSSSHKKGEAVIISDASLDEEQLRMVIGDTGYTVGDITEKPYEKKKGMFGWFK